MPDQRTCPAISALLGTLACGPGSAPNTATESTSTVTTSDTTKADTASSAEPTTGSSPSADDSTSAEDLCIGQDNPPPISDEEAQMIAECEALTSPETCIGKLCEWFPSKLSPRCDGECPSTSSGVCVAVIGAETGCYDPCQILWRLTDDGLQLIHPSSRCLVAYVGWQMCNFDVRPECDCPCDAI